MTQHSQQFEHVIESLLAQHFICSYSDSAAYDYLSQEAYRTNVDEFLRKIGRCLRQTDDKNVYYGAYSAIDNKNTRQHIRQQFRETINDLEPLCRWLSLVMSAFQQEAPITSGNIIRQGDLLSALEQTQALEDDLALIVRGGLFNTQKEAPKDQLNHVLTVLVSQGYLVQATAQSSLYTATGKWSYLFEVLAFIHSHEDIGAGHQDNPQEGLL